MGAVPVRMRGVSAHVQMPARYSSAVVFRSVWRGDAAWQLVLRCGAGTWLFGDSLCPLFCCPAVNVVVGHRRGGAIGWRWRRRRRLVLGAAGAVRGWGGGRRWLSPCQQSEPRHNPGDGPPSPPRGAFPRGQHRALQEHQDLPCQGGWYDWAAAEWVPCTLL